MFVCFVFGWCKYVEGNRAGLMDVNSFALIDGSNIGRVSWFIRRNKVGRDNLS